MDELVQLDALAAARFASVFLDFQNAEDYADVLRVARRAPRTRGPR